MLAIAKKVFHYVTYGHAASAFFGIFSGRTTFFACVFAVIGAYGWLVVGRDLTSFALFAGAIQALLTVKSGLEDYHDRKTQTTTIVDGNTTVQNTDSK